MIALELADLIENPDVRLGFDASTSHYADFPRPGDVDELAAFTVAAGTEWFARFRRWCEEQPREAIVVRRATGELAAMSIVCMAGEMPAWAEDDIETGPVLEDLRETGQFDEAAHMHDTIILEDPADVAGCAEVIRVGNAGAMAGAFGTRNPRYMYVTATRWNDFDGTQPLGYVELPELRRSDVERELETIMADFGPDGVPGQMYAIILAEQQAEAPATAEPDQPGPARGRPVLPGRHGPRREHVGPRRGHRGVEGRRRPVPGRRRPRRGVRRIGGRPAPPSSHRAHLPGPRWGPRHRPAGAAHEPVELLPPPPEGPPAARRARRRLGHGGGGGGDPYDWRPSRPPPEVAPPCHACCRPALRRTRLGRRSWRWRSARASRCTPCRSRYGQRHAVEIEAAQRVAAVAGVAEHMVVDIDLRAFGGSALTADIDVPKHDAADAEMGAGIPVTYVPARNTIFLSFALAWAEVLGASDIFIGVNALDYSGYPDCRPEYIEAFERMANLATQGGRRGHARG